jgi:hypothetical protein
MTIERLGHEEQSVGAVGGNASGCESVSEVWQTGNFIEGGGNGGEGVKASERVIAQKQGSESEFGEVKSTNGSSEGLSVSNSGG